MLSHVIGELRVLARFILGWLFTLVMASTSFLTAILGFPKQSWLWFCRPWGRAAVKIVGVHLDIVGRQNLVGPAIFVSNHQSLIDVVFLPAILPPKSKWIAKKELMRVPVWGWAFGAGGAIFIDRKDPRGAIHAIREGIKALPSDWSIVVFPEGTRSRDGRLQRFKRGFFHMAMQTRLPIVPIAMSGAHEVTPAGASLVRAATVHVTVGAPISTEAWTDDEIDQRVEEVKQAVQVSLEASEARRRPAAEASEPEPSFSSLAHG